jgi:hypothetical protein
VRRFGPRAGPVRGLAVAAAWSSPVALLVAGMVGGPGLGPAVAAARTPARFAGRRRVACCSGWAVPPGARAARAGDRARAGGDGASGWPLACGREVSSVPGSALDALGELGPCLRAHADHGPVRVTGVPDGDLCRAGPGFDAVAEGAAVGGCPPVHQSHVTYCDRLITFREVPLACPARSVINSLHLAHTGGRRPARPDSEQPPSLPDTSPGIRDQPAAADGYRPEALDVLFGRQQW